MTTATLKCCPKCKEAKPLEEFHRDKGSKDGRQTYCKKCFKDMYQGSWRAEHFKSKYGLSLEKLESMAKDQGGTCAICPGKPECVDHCHDTGKVRGLLCHRCNRALGSFKDDPVLLEQAINYLRR